MSVTVRVACPPRPVDDDDRRIVSTDLISPGRPTHHPGLAIHLHAFGRVENKIPEIVRGVRVVGRDRSRPIRTDDDVLIRHRGDRRRRVAGVCRFDLNRERLRGAFMAAGVSRDDRDDVHPSLLRCQNELRRRREPCFAVQHAAAVRGGRAAKVEHHCLPFGIASGQIINVVGRDLDGHGPEKGSGALVDEHQVEAAGTEGIWKENLEGCFAATGHVRKRQGTAVRFRQYDAGIAGNNLYVVQGRLHRRTDRELQAVGDAARIAGFDRIEERFARTDQFHAGVIVDRRAGVDRTCRLRERLEHAPRIFAISETDDPCPDRLQRIDGRLDACAATAGRAARPVRDELAIRDLHAANAADEIGILGLVMCAGVRRGDNDRDRAAPKTATPRSTHSVEAHCLPDRLETNETGATSPATVTIDLCATRSGRAAIEFGAVVVAIKAGTGRELIECFSERFRVIAPASWRFAVAAERGIQRGLEPDRVARQNRLVEDERAIG